MSELATGAVGFNAIGVSIVVLMLIFIAIWLWAWLPHHKKNFDALARMPMSDGAPAKSNEDDAI